MSKNPVFEFFRQQGATVGPDSTSQPSDDLTIIGQKRVTKLFQRPLSYHGFKMNAPEDVVETIALNPHPTNVFADSSLWAPDRLDLVRRLLIQTPVRVLPAVLRELEDIKHKSPGPMQELLFPKGSLNPRLSVEKYDAVLNYKYVMNRYVNLLHVRKRLLEGPLREYQEQTGQPAKGKSRHKIMQKALNDGVSQRTLRLANKGDKKRRYTDEVLSVYAVLSPILTGRDSFVLTADRDVFDQLYQFSVLLHDDYGSFLIAQDYRTNPHRYPHAHAIRVPYMEKTALAVGRQLEPDYLLPKCNTTCAVWVVDVRSLECCVWVGLREIAAALDYQEKSHDGRVGDGGEGRNVHISGHGTNCSAAPAHFVIGHDIIRQRVPLNAGELTLSAFDLFRVCVDRGMKS